MLCCTYHLNLQFKKIAKGKIKWADVNIYYLEDAWKRHISNSENGHQQCTFFKHPTNQIRPFKGYIKDDRNLRKLSENIIMLLGYVFETAYVINKIKKE